MAGLLSAAILISTSAMADIRPYVSFKGGYDFLRQDVCLSAIQANPVSGQADFNANNIKYGVFAGKVAIGVAADIGDTHGGPRAELEFGISGEKQKKNIGGVVTVPGIMDFPGNIHSITSRDLSFMLNLYYDIDTGTPFTPYVGCGIGATSRKVKADVRVDFLEGQLNFSVQNALTWQVSCGVCYAINENLSLDVGYRYTDMSRMDSVSLIVGSGSASVRMRPKAHEVLAGIRYTF
jgi:opacity protein-like surface antigen